MPEINRKTTFRDLIGATIKDAKYGATDVATIAPQHYPTYGIMTIVTTSGKEFLLYANAHGEIDIAEVIR